MAINPNPVAAVLLLCLLAPPSSSVSPIISELSVLQSQSPAGVIHLTDALLRRVLSLPTPRPFHFMVFFDAQKLHSKPDLALPTLKSEYSLISSSFQSNNPDKKSLILFFEIEFEESQSSFSVFGINSLPNIRMIPPSAVDLKTDSIQMEASDYSRFAESMAEFIDSRTNLSVGPINRPPAISRTQIGIVIAAVLIWMPFLIKRLISGNTILHEKSAWIAGAIFVYFFSVSGTMFNVIRKMPLFLVDKQDPDRLVFFYKGSGTQLGAEGFAVGFLYTIVGLLLAFVVHGLVGVSNRAVQRLMMMVAMFVSVWAVREVVFLDNWKTGYRAHGYWPSSWR
ncbi:probable dolichyl-diphosphooligosaccharide--protein glycosyltransferase subunit 3b [Phtheirospermum japonicum]|uniref:Probable dolichyl-diphosphooligosaccharide--protein glycosyltransferase subunit 3b n=1 Tax=Phtheirospermum japonicum TaxID=374723 RepID=A0A830CFH3_9LAMI|nr:probable dolichyl-diphosphooligosaccharide--protein glycosyltransferase subunit 3b [Phtheirospermum japonicum]